MAVADRDSRSSDTSGDADHTSVHAELLAKADLFSGLERVTLSGGVFLNAFVTDGCARDLAAAGFDVLRHHRVPASDAGIALGQVAVLAHAGATTAVPSRVPQRRPTSPEMESPCV